MTCTVYMLTFAAGIRRIRPRQPRCILFLLGLSFKAVLGCISLQLGHVQHAQSRNHASSHPQESKLSPQVCRCGNLHHARPCMPAVAAADHRPGVTPWISAEKSLDSLFVPKGLGAFDAIQPMRLHLSLLGQFFTCACSV